MSSTKLLPRQRVPSLAESTCSFTSETDEESTKTTQQVATRKSKHLDRRRSSISEVANSTFFRKRLSRQSSLPWGHRRSTMIGMSCFLFLLPIPCLIKSCCPFAAAMLFVVTVSSFSSDYLYSGVESWSHLFDRALAPIAFVSNIHAVYSLFGIMWLLPAVLCVKCHVMAMYYSKQNNYDQFVIFHSLWHATGVGSILLSFFVNGLHECLGA
mmetsp:Transcript_20042/g.32841  ORF Transcript_20042/g.32841 Transcript_20042/m.32841 type:complete len:212 (+) Transcript_20042:122-757(+)